MPAEGQVKQGNMCFAVGGPSVDCEEAAAVGASSFFPEYDLKAAAGRCSVQLRHICACKHCKAEQALGHLKFAHAEACHLQDQSKFDGKRHDSQFRSGICFQYLPIMYVVGGARTTSAGRCVALVAGKVEFRQCSSVGGAWEMRAMSAMSQKRNNAQRNYLLTCSNVLQRLRVWFQSCCPWQWFRQKKLHFLQDFEERLDPADIVKIRSSAVCFHAALCLLGPQCCQTSLQHH